MPKEPRAQPRAGSARQRDGNRASANDLIPAARIAGAILQLRGQKVMLDRDLATLYGVTTGALKRAVKRHATRFPDDFMFVINGTKISMRMEFLHPKTELGLGDPRHVASLEARLILVPLMFVMTREELANWRCQFGTSKAERIHKPTTVRAEK